MHTVESSAEPESGEPERWSPTLREIADELLAFQRVELLDRERLTFVPPHDFSEMRIVSSLTRAFHLDGAEAGEHRWECSGSCPWEFADGTDRFAVPDLTVGPRESMLLSDERFRASIVLLAEVVDQAESSWALYDRHRTQGKYKIHSTGHYGESGVPIDLPEPFGFSIPTAKWPPYVKGEK